MATLLDYALCTVADVKENLGIDAGNHVKDNLITRKINQATEIIESYTGRRFKETTYTDELYNGTRTDQLVLRNRPIISTEPITLKVRNTSLNDADTTTVDSEFYFVDYNAGILNAVQSFWGYYDRWLVTYTAGYATIPTDVSEAAATLATYLTNNPTGVSSNTRIIQEGSRRVEYYDASGKSIIELLNLDSILSRYTDTVITGL